MPTTYTNPHVTKLQMGDLTFSFLRTGDIQRISYQDIMINQLISNPIDGSLNNIYLRLFDPNHTRLFPLLGAQSSHTMQEFRQLGEQQLYWDGQADEVHYRVTFTLTLQGVWFWDVELNGLQTEADLIYGQDLGLADTAAVRSNEAYLSQYIDHTVYNHEQQGFIVCSRQNQPQSSGFPYLQQGSLSAAIGYSTDGFQFFGLDYKRTHQPAALELPTLVNRIYQYEFAYIALQSERMIPTDDSKTPSSSFTFYGLFRPDHPAAVTQAEYADVLREARQGMPAVPRLHAHPTTIDTTRSVIAETGIHPDARFTLTESRPKQTGDQQTRGYSPGQTFIGSPLTALELDDSEIELLFPNRYEEERENEQLLSFFKDTYEHVVLQAKELRVERPHGHILMGGHRKSPTRTRMTTTSYMYGIFNAQVVTGNTNFNKLITHARNALNVTKTSGQRIYVELDGQYRLLAMPSAFEMGFNYARWYYKTSDDVLIVTNETTVDQAELKLHLHSEAGKSYRHLITQQISMNMNEYEIPYQMKVQEGLLLFHADPEAPSSRVYPQLEYRLLLEGASMSIGDERLLHSTAQPGEASLVVLALEPSSEWELTIKGLLHGENRNDEISHRQPADSALTEHKDQAEQAEFIKQSAQPYRPAQLRSPERSSPSAACPDSAKHFEQKREQYRRYIGDLLQGFRLTQAGQESEELFRMNAVAWWYTHNMLVHYSVPHGLEQYGGAAWGTRDVCQGPVEFFMATQQFDEVRSILCTVYSHQYEDTGHWPQWFMFDDYVQIQQEESHGDIIVWPLKVLADYLTATRDYSILEEKVPYMDRERLTFTTHSATVLEHALKELEYIQQHFLHDTHLSAYGDGDWDDTLQPANAELKQFMASSWTVALTYQAVERFASALAAASSFPALVQRLQSMAEGIRQDFDRYMLSDDVIPGFIYMKQPGQMKRMLHPSDIETGIAYRLLPMTRSMISGLLTMEQAEAHEAIIHEHLLCPDGVRLMNRPASYDGGVSSRFKRAEQAANFGREVGLQYVHAHIRYVEAMAKLGRCNQAWNGLQLINPVGLHHNVPNAALRQSNAYFSSSDGAFHDRYEAEQQFEKLRTGEATVKGGWRIYSSGPGIYLGQLITSCLGIRQEGGDLVLDPVLPATMDNLELRFAFAGHEILFHYQHTGQGQLQASLNGQPLPTTPLSNRYRTGGIRICREDVIAACREENNLMDIRMK